MDTLLQEDSFSAASLLANQQVQAYTSRLAEALDERQPISQKDLDALKDNIMVLENLILPELNYIINKIDSR